MSDAEALLEQALVHWRKNPDPDLGAAITELGAWCAHHREPIGPSRQSMGAGEAWSQRAAHFDPADLSLLLAKIHDTRGGSPPKKKVMALAEWPLDPRISTELIALFERKEWRGHAARGLRRSIVDVLRCYAHVPEAARHLQMWRHQGIRGVKPYGREVHADLLRIPIQHPIAIPDDPEADRLRAACQRQAAVPNAPSRPAVISKLWEAVWQSPEDLAARAVLADALQAQADPRGDFMQMQLLDRPDTRGRERLLLKTWERTWLGPLAPYTARSGHRWEGGLLTRVHLRSPLPDIDMPLLNAVTEIHLGEEGRLKPYLKPGKLPQLQTLTGLSAGSDVAHPRVTHVGGLRMGRGKHVVAWADAAHLRFPNLRSLSFRWCLGLDVEGLAPLSSTPVLQQLEWLELPGRNMPELLQHLAVYQSLFAGIPLKLVPRSGISDQNTVGWHLALHGRTLAFHLGTLRKRGLSPTEQLTQFFTLVPIGCFDHVRVIAPKRAKLETNGFTQCPWPIEFLEP